MPQVDFNEDGSCWVEIRAGRKRFFGPQSSVAIAAREGLLKSKIGLLNPTDRDHTKRVVYRDADGKLGVPMTPDMIPAGCERIEVTSLRQEDQLAAEMRRDLEERFSGDREVTAYLDQAMADENGNTPRDILKSSTAFKTDFGRELCQEMLKALDKEEHDREKVDVNFFFHSREYDR